MLRVWPPTLSAYEFVETRGKPKIDQRGEHIGGLSGSTSRMWMRCAGRSASPNPQTGNAQQRGRLNALMRHKPASCFQSKRAGEAVRSRSPQLRKTRADGTG